MAKKPILDFIKGNNSKFVSVQDYINSGTPINLVPTNTGLFNTSLTKPGFSYEPSPGAKIVSSVRDSYIVMGQVPNGGDSTGYGRLGAPADSIDLVVGRGASSRNGEGPPENARVDNNFGSDAARVYISRLCDVDQYFGLASNPSSNQGRGLVGRSGIGLKADGVRIIGREGVKITTGKMIDASGFGPRGETNSLGGNIGIAPRIELIAGNNYDNVQGVGLGENIVDCLTELSDIVGQVLSQLESFARYQKRFNTQAGIAFATIAPVPQPAAATSATINNLRISSLTSGPLGQTRNNLNLWKINYLNRFGNSYIESKNVMTN
jgi:hypothetical protein